MANIESLSALCLYEIVDDFYSIWTNLPDETTNQGADSLFYRLLLLSECRQRLCRDKRLLAWYLLNGLAHTGPFAITVKYDDWTDTTPKTINDDNFQNYNNWKLTTTTRIRLLDDALGRRKYDPWNFKHPLPPTRDELTLWLGRTQPTTLLNINGILHDLDWIMLK